MNVNGWKQVKLDEIVNFNPRESIKKGELAKKIPMEKLIEFNREVAGYEITPFKGGTKFRNGDTLQARITPCLENGKTAYIDILGEEEVAFGSTEYNVWRAKVGITDSKFLYYLSTSPAVREASIKSMTGSTGRQRTQLDTIRNIEVIIPELTVQKQIGEILSKFDDKISINKKVITKLEETSQLLFKHWFIDFEFPNEEGQPYKSSDGKMVKSELEMMPEGWQPLSLEELVDDTIGGDWGKESPQGNYEEKVHVVRGADLNDLNKGIYTKMPERYILPKNYRNKKLRPLDLIIEISGGSPTQSTGRISLITNEVIDRFDNKLISTNFCRIIRLKDVTYSMFFFHWWKFFYEKNIFFQYENGTTGIKNLDLKSFLKNSFLAIPENSQIEKFNQLNSNVLKNIFSLSEENIKLTQLRDTLLPKLLSGEIEVPVKEPESV